MRKSYFSEKLAKKENIIFLRIKSVLSFDVKMLTPGNTTKQKNVNSESDKLAKT
jgi:hypothetical protein